MSFKKENLVELWLNQKYFTFFENHFQENQEILDELWIKWYKVEKIFFRDILSWDFHEIECFEEEKMDHTFVNGKSELVPVLVFFNENNRFCTELHFHGNVF